MGCAARKMTVTSRRNTSGNSSIVINSGITVHVINSFWYERETKLMTRRKRRRRKSILLLTSSQDNSASTSEIIIIIIIILCKGFFCFRPSSVSGHSSPPTKPPNIIDKLTIFLLPPEFSLSHSTTTSCSLRPARIALHSPPHLRQ